VVPAGAGISTGLVVARQLASFIDNARLLGELDTKVRELHETETVLRAALEERDGLATRLRELAFQDSLTGLANRALFYDRLGEALLRARRHGRQVVVMLLDLDDFKPINDRFGHAAGDAVLKEVALRLRGCLRETDTVARIGGDEFAVLLDDPHAGGVDAVAQRIAAAVREPCWVDGERIAVGVSIGVAFDQSGDADTDRLLSDADAAMYAAKGSGKGGHQTFASSLRESSGIA
jgi:diguanylate cyclase (GGDEF)-like protein